MALTLNKRAEDARTALFERYDELNALWTQAEEQITKLHIPCGVECFYYSWADDPQTDYENNHFVLGIQKIGGKWRICHGYCCDSGGQEVSDWTAITECSAETRVRAAPHLSKLREEVVMTAERFIPRVDKAINELRESMKPSADIKDLLAERAKLNGKAM